MTTKFSKREIEEAKEYLKFLVPGQEIYADVKHVSRSGMYRVISLKIVRNGQIEDISWAAAKLLEGWDDRHYGCKASGCGQDMCFHLVYNLGYVLFPYGYDCIGEGCKHNSHSNSPYPKRDGTTHHEASGYVFKYRG